MYSRLRRLVIAAYSLAYARAVLLITSDIFPLIDTRLPVTAFLVGGLVEYTVAPYANATSDVILIFTGATVVGGFAAAATVVLGFTGVATGAAETVVAGFTGVATGATAADAVDGTCTMIGEPARTKL